MKKKILNKWDYNKCRIDKTDILIFGIFFILIVAPLINQGVMHNDELRTRITAMGGIRGLLNYYIPMSAEQGRIISGGPVSIYFFTQFFSINIVIFRIMAVIIISVNVILFSYIIYIQLGSKKLTLIFILMFSLFMPITFEETPPNVFVGFLGIPFGIFMLSIILYIKYIKTKKTRLLIMALVCLLVSLISYEAFITLTPLYLIVLCTAVQRGEIDKNKIVKYIAYPFFVSVAYLGLYFWLKQRYASGYEGTQVSITSIRSSVNVISQLVKSSTPGYFLFNDKYSYLFNVYSHNSIMFNTPIFKQIFANGIQGFSFVINKLFSMRILILSILSIYIFNKETKETKSYEKMHENMTLLGIFSFVLIIFITLPFAITIRTQESIELSQTIVVPATYIMYFLSVLILSILIFKLTKISKNKAMLTLIMCFILIFAVPVQAMNETVSSEQNANYNRLVRIEKLMETEVWKSIENESITAEDLYKTKNTLAIHDGYFSQYSDLKGKNIRVLNEPKNIKYPNVYYQDDEIFVLSEGNDLKIISDKSINEMMPIKIAEDIYTAKDFGNYEKLEIDGSFFVYTFDK